MTLRRKTLSIFTVTFLLLMLLLFLSVQVVLVDAFDKLEQETIRTDVSRARNTVDLELKTLETTLSDWAPWDDTYSFMQNRERKYIESNLGESTFISLRLNFMIFFNEDGAPVFAQGFNLDSKQVVPISDEIYLHLRRGSPLLLNRDLENSVSGLLTTAQGPVLIASRPITDSDKRSSPRGTMVVGRYLDANVIRQLSDTVQSAVTIRLVKSDMPAMPVNYNSPDETEIVIQALPENRISGYVTITDIYGLPALQLGVEEDRKIYTQGQNTKNYFLLAIFFVSLVFCVLMMYFLKKNVLDRLSALNSKVNTIGQNQDLSVRLPVSGRDELSSLASNINRMLTSLEQSQERLQYMARNDALTGLFNRAYFEERVRAIPANSSQFLCAVACDVDGLKLVNDSLGHAHGDSLLVIAANTLRKACPDNAIIARTGGDEFGVLYVGDSSDIGDMICLSIQEAVERYNQSTPLVPLCMSAGSAVGAFNSEVKALFQEADANMYRRKLLCCHSARSAIVQTLKKTLEARDFITDGHANRLEELVAEIGGELGLTNQQITDLQLLAQFHDIGKVGIPDAILFKPGPLTHEEQAIMRGHSEIGYRIAQAAPDLEPIADFILKHHEWWDGTGYPLGTRGEDIPLACRILSIVDDYDAMTNDRPYRKAMSSDAAVKELYRSADSQFDRRLVELFGRILERRGLGS